MKHFLAILSIVVGLELTAQQGNNFSLWFLNNLQHNPAAVGAIDNNFRLYTNYRSQYLTLTSRPFQTISGSMEGKMFQSRRNRHYMGLGGSFINDVSGDGRYAVNDIKIPIAAHIFINDENSISLGISPGVYQRSISPDNFKWESQWNGKEFDQSMPSLENYATTSAMKFDLGAGIYYKYDADHDRQFYGGVSVNHLLTPPLDFKIMDDLMRRYTAHFGGKYRLSNSMIGISPQILTMFQGPNRNIIFGTNVDFYIGGASKRTKFSPRSYISVGLYHRFQDAMVANIQYVIEGLTIAAAYDANLSIIQHSRGVGAFEIVLMYDISFNNRRKFIF